MHLSELKSLHVSKLLDWALDLGIENANRMRKQELMFAILKKRAKEGEQIFGDGTLEILPDGFGFLRSPETSYLASTDDIYISPSQIRRFNLHTGDSIEGEVRTPKDGERYSADPKIARDGQANVSHAEGDFVLAAGKTYRAKKDGELLPGAYTVLAANDATHSFKLRVGGFVRNFVHGDALVLNENEEVCAVSVSVILR